MRAFDASRGLAIDARVGYDPAPVDAGAVAREYVLLGLRCGRLLPGLVDAYSGDPSVRAKVASQPPPRSDELGKRATFLRAELSSSGLATRRADFLDRQLAALECAMRALSGTPPPFRAELRAYFDTEVEWGEPDRYREAHTELAELLPGGGPLAARMAAYRKREEVPSGLLGPAVQALSGALRALVGRTVELPAGEAVYYELARDRPWSAFNHYLGGYRSKVVVNADMARRVSSLPHLVAHEAYPGHHTERCRRESVQVRGEGRAEHTLFLVNTPECLLSEGLAELGLLAAVGPSWGRWTQGVLDRLGIRVDGELAERVERAVARLAPARQDAALMLHERRADPDEVLAYLRRWLLVSEPRAAQMLRFMRHPVWRAYTTTYVEGRRLVRGWLAATAPGEPVMARFRRLLDEPLTPSAVRAEMGKTAAPKARDDDTDVNAG